MKKNKSRPITFVKMVAAGNDFIVLDNRKRKLTGNYSQLSKELCKQHFSIGADGLLILENSNIADFKMLYFNSDGSQAAMCGNGARCIAYYAYINKIANREMQFETLTGVIKAKVIDSKVRISFAEPKDIRIDFSLQAENLYLVVSYVNTGVPHTVIFVDNIEEAKVNELGRKIRYHTKFLPAGTNANFVKVVNKHQLHIRTYERGIEAETFACGTGAVATAVISAIKGLVKSPVRCKTTGGELLTVYFKFAGINDLVTPVYNINLEGKVKVVFSGIRGSQN